jgi:phage baseplate assembly protein W
MDSSYTDIDLSLRRQKDGDVRQLTDLEAIESNITNIMLTMQGGRRMLPEFAYNAYNILGDAITEANAKGLGNIILNALNAWEDRIVIENVNVMGSLSKKCYVVTLKFNLKEFGSGVIYTLNYILKQL